MIKTFWIKKASFMRKNLKLLCNFNLAFGILIKCCLCYLSIVGYIYMLASDLCILIFFSEIYLLTIKIIYLNILNLCTFGIFIFKIIKFFFFTKVLFIERFDYSIFSFLVYLVTPRHKIF